MSVGGNGPCSVQLKDPRALPFPMGNLSPTSTGLSLLVYNFFSPFASGIRPQNEIYLRGWTLLDKMEEYFGEENNNFGDLDRRAFAKFFDEMEDCGRLQKRGPHTWALAYDEFTTLPGVMPSREAIFARDNWQCRYCLADLRGGKGHIDHVLPKSRGGWDDAANVVASCRMCNARKGARTPGEWRAADPVGGRCVR